MRPYLVAIGLLSATLLTPAASYAANAGNPYGNVNHANDAGNDTGDAQVDQLNQAQLNSNGVPAQSYPGGGAPSYAGPAVAPSSPYAPPSYYAQPPGYAPPPGAPPPGYRPQGYQPQGYQPSGYPPPGYQPPPPPGYAPPGYPPPGYPPSGYGAPSRY